MKSWQDVFTAQCDAAVTSVKAAQLAYENGKKLADVEKCFVAAHRSLKAAMEAVPK